MGFWVTFHIHNHVGTNRDNLVLGVLPDVVEGFFHQNSGVAVVLLVAVNLGMDEVTLSWHQGVVS